MLTMWFEGPKDGNIWGRYGLDSREWVGSLSDRVAAIVDKGTPSKDIYVNALLRDSAQFFAYKSQDHPELGDDDQMRDAISYAARSGVIINDENLLALTDADDKYVIPFGGESLMYEYNKMHQPDYGSLYQRRQRESVQVLYGDPTDDEIKQHYGLDPHEWTGSLADRVMAIVNKNAPEKETHVNALLRDSARLFVQNAQLYMNSDNSRKFDALIECGGEELRAAISDASWSGVLINDEAMDAIKLVEKGYMVYYGGESLTRSYEQMHKINDARAHYRGSIQKTRTQMPDMGFTDRLAPPQGSRVTTAPSPILQRSKTPTPTQAVQIPRASRLKARVGGPVRVGLVAQSLMGPMGRGMDDQKDRAGYGSSIQAAMPGSNITVGQSGVSGPSGQSMSREPSTVRRVGIPVQEVQAHTSSIDDDFEL